MKRSPKLIRIISITSILIFIAAFSINAKALFVDSTTQGSISLTNLLAQANADGESGGALKWSTTTACPSSGQGGYQVCNVNGTGNSCSTAGAVTCTCGVNCD